MPEYFESHTLLNSDVLERLDDPSCSGAEVKSRLFETPLRRPEHTEIIRPGISFFGLQSSTNHTYNVQVTFQDVDLSESFLSGYLTIQGLTDEYPSLTTFFEGEVIGNKYSFRTRKWEASSETDIAHWGRFNYWVQKYQKDIYDDSKTAAPSEDSHVFMRWKEQFLVPNHRVTQVAGASYSGFYYTCLEVATGTIDGYYFHSNSEKFQRLTLECDRKDYSPSFEFR